MKKIFITGATGFIGGRLAKRLADMDYKVNALCRTSSKAAFLDYQNINIIQGDLFDLKALAEGMEGTDVVFHLAAHASMTAKHENMFHDINVKGTRNILEQASESGVKRVVFTSTAGVLGPSGNTAVDESHQREVDFFSKYESTKHEAEQLVNQYVNLGMDIVTVCPPRVYGPGYISESNAVTKMISRYLEGNWRLMPGKGDRIGNYVYVDDVVEGHIRAWQYGRNGEKYILGGSNITLKEFFDTVATVCHRHYTMYSIPSTLIMNTARLMEWGAKLSGTRPFITFSYANKFLNYHFELNCEKAMEELGYTITPLEEGIKKTVKWLKQQQNNSNEEKPYTLITGASSGIGKAIAIQCAHKGYNLVLVALPGQHLKEFGRNIEAYNNIKVLTFELDLTERSSPEMLFNWCLINDVKVNMLINNAGMGQVGAFENISPDALCHLMTLNMQSLALLTRMFLPVLKSNKRSYILNVGSMASFHPVPFKSIYAASKSFVLSFSRSLREELKYSNVNVSCLCPGPTLTSEEVIQRVKAAGWRARLLTLSADEVAIIALDGLVKNKAVIMDWKNGSLKTLTSILPVVTKIRILGSVFRKEQKNLQSIPQGVREMKHQEKEKEKMVV